MLNLACGGRMHTGWNNLDYSEITRLARHPILSRFLRKTGILSEKRYVRLLATDPDIICWDLRKGIPFADGTFDVVFHSHFLEHLDRQVAPVVLQECRRVLKPSGILRVVVPDLEQLCRNYVHTIQAVLDSDVVDSKLKTEHDVSINRLLKQMVPNPLSGTSEQPKIVRVVERFIRGDSARAGEMHRWMYDQVTLTELLLQCRYQDVRVQSYCKSSIEDWPSFYLDEKRDGSIFKRGSIYLEAEK